MKKSNLQCFYLLFLTFVITAKTQTFEWAKSIGGVNSNYSWWYDYGRFVAVDGIGSVYTIGAFADSSDFDPNIGVYKLYAKGGIDLFISKLDSSGNFVWAKQIGGMADDLGIGIELDNQANVYITGYFEDSVDFDPGGGTYKMYSKGAKDAFVLKMDSAGVFKWAKQIGSSNNQRGITLAYSSSDDAVYVSGIFSDTTDLDPGSGTAKFISIGLNDIFLVKLKANGNFIWAKQIGGPSMRLPTDMTIDPSGKYILQTGAFYDTTDFDPGIATRKLIPQKMWDGYILNIDTSGQFIWVKQLSGNNVGYGLSIACDNSGSIFSSGVFSDTVDFDPGIGTYTLDASGNFQDIFVMKLSPTGNFSWAKRIGGTNSDVGSSIAVDNAGDVYVSGYFENTVDFDPGSGLDIKNSGSGNYSDGYVLKLDNFGGYIWAQQLHGVKNDLAGTIYVSPNRNIYITGVYSDTCNFNPFTTGPFEMVSKQTRDVWVLKWEQPDYTGINYEDNSEPQKALIYPNPSTGNLFIELSNGFIGANFKIIDAIGQEVVSQKVQQEQNYLNLQDLAPGVYFFLISNSFATIRQPIIIN